MEHRAKTRIRKIPQYNQWVQLHDIEMEADDGEELHPMDQISEIPEDNQDYVS
jgi:hypothetical protein